MKWGNPGAAPELPQLGRCRARQVAPHGIKDSAQTVQIAKQIVNQTNGSCFCI